MEILLQVVFLVVAFAVVFVLLHAAFGPRYLFMAKIERGEPHVTKGKVHADFLAEIRTVCREHGIASGWIGGVKRGKTIALRFSASIPPGCQQRLRNIWF